MTPRILLVGMMGAGKTTTGRLVSERLGWGYRDSDADVESITGLTVPELFARDGEAAFRRAEATVLAQACADPSPSIVSVAGGAVLSEDIRKLIASSGVVVWLRARPDTLAARVGTGIGRPLLGDDPAEAVVRLDAVRAPLYAELADIVLDVDELDPMAVADRIIDAMDAAPPSADAGPPPGQPGTGSEEHEPMHALSVDLAERSYPVLVGPGARHEVARFVPPTAKSAVIVTQQSIQDAGWVDGLDAGVPFEVCVIPDGEGAKTLATIEVLARFFAGAGLSRADVVVAVGGGIVTDVAGFAAATYHRGTPYINVATSLLAQVDAAIGGKTGVNLPEGKNLVGAFWQPNAVLCDTETLSSLPPREWACGRGEIAKYAFLGDAPTADQSIEEQVARCAGIKAAVVAEDEREGGRRVILNYGHTLAHALEGAGQADHPDWDLRHGEAVAIGVLFAALLAQRLGRIDADRVAEHRRIIGSFDLPTDLPPGAEAAELVAFMGRDKKAQQDLTFVLDGPDGVEPVRGVALRRRGRYPGCHGCPHVSLVLLLSGPNLNLLGEREPAVYGTDTLAMHVARSEAAAARHGLELEHLQTNHEGDLVEAVHAARGKADALVVNAGALSHTSWSLHDAVAAFDGPVVELHLSNPAGREPFRHTSVLAPVASGLVAGFGGLGYELAIDAAAALLKGT